MGLINYLELFVFRPAGEGEASERGVATVVVAGRDLFGSLERSVAELRKAGWAVDDVKAFKTDFKPDDDALDERLRYLCEHAREEGIDWFLEPLLVEEKSAV